MVSSLLVKKTLLTFYGFNTSASRQVPAEGMLVHADWQVNMKVTPTKPLQITTDTSLSLLDHASIGCHSRETPLINPGQWDSFGGLIRCPVSPLWLLAIISDHYVVESHTHFHSSLTGKMLCKVFNAF